MNFGSIMHSTKQNSEKKTASSLFKVLFFLIRVQRLCSDRRERADVERQTGPKPDLFAGKAVETAAEVEGIKKKKAKQQQQKELIAKRRQPITFRV